MRITREYANPAGFSQGLGAGHGRNCTAPAESAYSFPMTCPKLCACESVHGFPCQFPGETDFFDFDGKKWCRFHLPLQDAAGNKSPKGREEKGWEEGGAERQVFTEAIYNSIRTASSWDGDPDDDMRADLRGVAFPHYFSFSGKTLPVTPINADFGYASFGDRVWFEGATFGDYVDFARATFGDSVSFNEATFGAWVRFNEATFGDWVSFNEATFGNHVNFEGATFGDYVFFDGATFGNYVFFDGATFGDDVRFRGAKFGVGTYFITAEFKGRVDFSALRPDGGDFNVVSFSGAIFKGPCRFTNRKFTAKANFNGAVFHDLAEFHGCEFHQDMSFHQTEFLKTRGEDDDKTEELERSYRTLKLGMEGLRARNEEADFFALEMDCRRQRRSVDWTERLAACLYKHLSDYGRSLVLPLLFFLLLLDVFFLIFGCFALAAKAPESIRLAGFTLQQVFRPFYVWGDVPKGTDNCLVLKYPLLIPLLASLQSLITIGLLTLFLLALRRRFKMD